MTDLLIYTGMLLVGYGVGEAVAQWRSRRRMWDADRERRIREWVG